MNTKEIKHIRDLVLTDMLNGNDKTINGSILRKLDEQLTIPDVVGRSEQLITKEQNAFDEGYTKGWTEGFNSGKVNDD